MSVGSDPQGNLRLIEETREQINFLVEELARLSERDLAPAAYYGEFLKGVLTALAAPAGAVWVRTPQGHLQLQFQVNMHQVGLDRNDVARQSHDELLREVIEQARPRHMPPHSSAGEVVDGTRPSAGNPTDFTVLLAPILIDKQVVGVLEIWQNADRSPKALQGFLQFTVRMAGLASRYIRNQQLRQMIGQQQLWTQLEAFTRQVHATLNPTEVAYLVANEGRRLVQCDRISVALRRERHPSIEAVSGADVVEKRSSLIQLMRALCDRVLHWGERLVYDGTKDDTLPPEVLKALDAYLSESNSKLLVLLPLRDEREAEKKKPARSLLVMECFDPNASTEQLVAQLEVVGRHAASALYNAVEHRRIPLRFLWQPLAKLQEGLGGKTRAILAGVGVAVLLLAGVMTFVPYPLKMDAKGQLLPEERRWAYSPVEAKAERFEVQPGETVTQDANLALMYDISFQSKLIELNSEIDGAQQDVALLNKQLASANNENDRARLSSDMRQKEVVRNRKIAEREALRERTNADDKPGYFWLKAPIKGTVLNQHFQEELTHRMVKPSDQLLRIGDKDGAWEVELKIPQKHIGQILRAYPPNDRNAELDVDVLVASRPERVFKGKLARGKIGGEAVPNRDDQNESEPVVLASVRLAGPGINPADQVPQDLLLTSTEIHANVRCGNHAMGYSLFYGMWEFVYEKVFLFF